jgi:hypothetical protein
VDRLRECTCEEPGNTSNACAFALACTAILIYHLSDVSFCHQHGHVLSRDGYVCVHAKAERFIASFYQQSWTRCLKAAGFLLWAKILPRKRRNRRSKTER